MSILDGRDERRRAELIAERLTRLEVDDERLSSLDKSEMGPR